VLVVLPNDIEENKIAVIAGRSVGGAVQRNYAKRRLRSAFQFFQSDVHHGYDLLLIARRPIVEAAYSSLLQALESLLDHAGLLKDRSH
jgi:ribonuclease P protein component